MSSRWFLALLGTFSLAALSWSQDLGEWTDSYVNGLAPAKHFRGTIVAERDGHVLVEKSYGEAVEEWQVPNSAETKFEIASLSKQFTAAAILQLADFGK
jgi:CubicO group peptidase (beta-lactamase class C family)